MIVGMPAIMVPYTYPLEYDVTDTVGKAFQKPYGSSGKTPCKTAVIVAVTIDLAEFSAAEVDSELTHQF